MLTLYGISNCDQVKKAKSWLESNNLEYNFYDFKTQGIDLEKLNQWLKLKDWSELFNKRSTTYRGLSDEQKQNLNEQSALAIMQASPTIIKRPVLEANNQLLIGFKAEQYQTLLENT